MRQKFLRFNAVFFIFAMLISLFAVGASAVETSTLPLAGKTISILGDSISTYGGISDNTASNTTIGNNVAYYKDNNFGFGADDTWWNQAAMALGARILVNNSFSASSFSMNSAGEAAYKNRCVQLHDDNGEHAGEKPDIIAVYLGTNDFSISRNPGNPNHNKIPVGYTVDYASLKNANSYKDPTNTAEAYAIMLDKMKAAYPDAEIYCFTLLRSTKVYCDPKENGQYKDSQPEDYEAMKEFNQMIKDVAAHYGAHIVDLYNDSGIETTKMNLHLANQVHPNKYGMDAITNCFLSSVYKNSKYLPTELQTHSITYKFVDNGIFKAGQVHTVLHKHSLNIEFFAETRELGKTLKVLMGNTDITATCKTENGIFLKDITDDVTIMNDHVHSYEEYTVEATCTKDGETGLKCACGHVKSSMPLPASGHKFEHERDISVPTCTKAGRASFKCVCGTSKIEVVPALGHSYADDTSEACEVCGEARQTADTEASVSDTTPSDTETTETKSGCRAFTAGCAALTLLSAFGIGLVIKKKI